MRKVWFFSVLGLAVIGPGCQKEKPSNVVTEYVDRGAETIHKAEAARDAMNAKTRQSDQQAAQTTPQ